MGNPLVAKSVTAPRRTRRLGCLISVAAVAVLGVLGIWHITSQSVVGADLWSWDGSDWTEMATQHQPPARSGANMVAVVNQRTILLYGGRLADGSSAVDTWKYDGHDWRQIHTLHHPDATMDAAYGSLAYDPGLDVVVYLTEGGDTWTFDGSDWALQRTLRLSEESLRGGMVYDPALRQIIYLGLDAAYAWKPAGWVVVPDYRPFPGCAAQSDYCSLEQPYFSSSRRAVLVPFGQSLFAWNGAQWRQESDASPTRGDNWVFDDIRSEFVSFGSGTDSAGTPPDTETYLSGPDGNRIASPAHVPPRRTEAAMVYDPVRARVFMFGGVEG